jgi:hypothetical protein
MILEGVCALHRLAEAGNRPLLEAPQLLVVAAGASAGCVIFLAASGASAVGLNFLQLVWHAHLMSSRRHASARHSIAAAQNRSSLSSTSGKSHRRRCARLGRGDQYDPAMGTDQRPVPAWVEKMFELLKQVESQEKEIAALLLKMHRVPTPDSLRSERRSMVLARMSPPRGGRRAARA